MPEKTQKGGSQGISQTSRRALRADFTHSQGQDSETIYGRTHGPLNSPIRYAQTSTGARQEVHPGSRGGAMV